jgi:diguanylate cyclase (GGDEF)-like protein/PAS domain S-box-containing protein
MTDSGLTPRFDHCLTLCDKAQNLHGQELARTLNQLRHELQALRTHAAENLPASGVSATNQEWSDEPIISMDMAGYLTGWNKGAQILFGYSPEEAIGQHILFLYAEEPSERNEQINELFLDHGTSLIQVRRRKKTGEIFRANLHLSHIFDQNKQPVGMVANFSEIKDQLSANDKQRLHAKIIEGSEEGILITDTDERIVSVNSAFTRITGYSAAEAIGNTPDLLRSGVHSTDFRAQVRAAMHGAGAWHGEIIGKRKNGNLFPQSVSIGVVRNEEGEVSHAFSIFSDISVLRAAEERMQQIVNYDSLTGLPNRTLFYQLVERTLATARRSHDHSALLVIDLNRFTSINDSLGHEVGDELLRQVGQRFRSALRNEDILARFGGDEFVIALVNIQKREHSGLVAEKLLASLDTLFVIDSHALHITASVGIATYPEDGMNTAELQRAADAAMKRVQKNKDSSYLFYSPEMNVRAKEQWQLEGELRHALGCNQLLLFYQPKVSLRTGQIVGAEALIRWPHQTHGMISPEKFVPLAEETGLIFELGGWVLEEACRQIRCWLDKGIEPLPIAVNLSARQFDSQLPERLRIIIEKHGIPCTLLRLEITESLLVRGPENVIPIMNDLVAMGFNLSLDDFGTGYSSLAYLKRFPITTLKIDRAFVIGVPDDENDCAIAGAIVTMGKQLRQEIVAEGVENKQQMAFLRALGCDQLQGYLFSPPVSAEAFELMCREGRRLSFD